MTHPEALEILRGLADALLETVREVGADGAPEGPLYAAFMSRGVSLDMFTQLVEALIAAGKVRRSGHVLYAV